MNESSVSKTKTHKNFFGGLRARLGIVGELFAFLWAAKMWWLIPMVIALMAFALLIVIGSASGGGPLIYTLF